MKYHYLAKFTATATKDGRPVFAGLEIWAPEPFASLDQAQRSEAQKIEVNNGLINVRITHLELL